MDLATGRLFLSPGLIGPYESPCDLQRGIRRLQEGQLQSIAGPVLPSKVESDAAGLLPFREKPVGQLEGKVVEKGGNLLGLIIPQEHLPDGKGGVLGTVFLLYPGIVVA